MHSIIVRRGIWFLCMLLLPLWSAGVKVQVNSTQIPRGQSLQVRLVAEGQKVLFPSLKKIGPWTVENPSQSMTRQMTVVNGKVSSRNRHELSFELFPTRDFTLPAMTVQIDGKKYRTQPIKISVLKPSQASQSRGFAVRMTATPLKAYVGEPVILTVDVLEPLNGAVARIEYRPPEFKDFFVKTLGGEQRLKEGSHTVHRLRYLLVPQKHGKLTVGPAQAHVGIRDLNAPSDPFGLFGGSLKWYDVRSDPVVLEVKPVPGTADLIGNYKVTARVNRKKVAADKPVEYTLTISGEGNLEDLEDPKIEIPGVTVYSDDAVVKSRIKGDRLLSTYTKKYVFISDRSFTIPALTFTQFDYRSGQSRMLKSPSISITVTGGTKAPAPSGTVAPQASSSAARPPAGRSSVASAPPVSRPKAKGNPLLDEGYYARKAYESKAAKLPWYMLGSFAAGMAAGIVLWIWLPRLTRRLKRKAGPLRHRTYDEALRILYPHINEDPEVERTVRDLYRIQNGEEVAVDRKRLDRLCARYECEERI